MKPAREQRCVFTGRLADELHHGSGQDPLGRYLDPHLVIPLSRRQHVLEHQGWGTEIADGVASHLNVLRLGRMGRLLVRLGEFHVDGEVVLPAETVRQIGLTLNRIALDQKEVGP